MPLNAGAHSEIFSLEMSKTQALTQAGLLREFPARCSVVLLAAGLALAPALALALAPALAPALVVTLALALALAPGHTRTRTRTRTRIPYSYYQQFK